MKPRGVKRAVGSVGRVVLPRDFRDHLNIEVGDDIEVFLADGAIIIRPDPNKNVCVLCSTEPKQGQLKHNGKTICLKCSKEFAVKASPYIKGGK